MSVSRDTRNNLWMATVIYTDWTGKRIRKRKTGFKTQRDAKEFETKLLAQKSRSLDIPVELFYKEYMEMTIHDLKPSTKTQRERVFRNYILPFFGKKLMSEVEPIDVKNWHNELRKSLKFKTIQSAHGVLVTFFNYANRYYGMLNNPASRCGGPRFVDDSKIDFWTIEEFNQVIKKNTGNVNPEILLIIKLLYWTGLRIGELMALTGNDLNYKTQSIIVSKSIYENIIQTPKTEKSKRIVAVPEEAWKELIDYMNMLYKYNSKDLLFTIGQSYIRRVFKRMAEVANIKPIRIHDLRHSHASLLIEMNISPLAIKDRLGHEKIQTTLDIYSHLYPNKGNEIAEKLNILFEKYQLESGNNEAKKIKSKKKHDNI